MQSRFLRALSRQPVDRTPVWIMRQAGRYLPEYRAVREQAGDFLTLCKTPELACEVTLQPLRRYALDAAIVFSDILTIPDAMGLDLHFVTHEGPKFNKPINTVADIARLGRVDPLQELRYVPDAISLIKQQLGSTLPLIGFAGSPWTLAAYMVEGGSSKTFAKAKQMLYQEPAAMQQLLNLLASNTIDYLLAQIQAGADAVMLFDSWGGILTTPAYQAFSLQPMQHIVQALKQQAPTTPIILFTKGGGAWLEWLAATGCDALGLDWTVDLANARARVGAQVALQGNMDPSVLLASPAVIRQETQRILENYGPGPGHIFNLGHGITPDVNPESVAVLINSVHELSATLHTGQLSK